jgi:hypothetical protein
MRFITEEKNETSCDTVNFSEKKEGKTERYFIVIGFSVINTFISMQVPELNIRTEHLCYVTFG